MLLQVLDVLGRWLKAILMSALCWTTCTMGTLWLPNVFRLMMPSCQRKGTKIKCRCQLWAVLIVTILLVQAKSSSIKKRRLQLHSLVFFIVDPLSLCEKQFALLKIQLWTTRRNSESSTSNSTWILYLVVSLNVCLWVCCYHCSKTFQSMYFSLYFHPFQRNTLRDVIHLSANKC